MKIKVACYDVEHQGDVDDASDEIAKAGGKILKQVWREADEAVYFLVEAGNEAEFVGKLEMCEIL